MDTFEENPMAMDDNAGQEQPAPQEAAPQPEQAPECAEAPAQEQPRKPSPYADSPYVMGYTIPAEKPKKAKKPRKPLQLKGKGTPLWLTIVLVLCGSLLSGIWAASYWQSQNAQTVAMLTGKVEDLQRQVDAVPAYTPGTSNAAAAEDGSPMTTAQLYDSCVDSVVAITTKTTAYYYGQSVEGSGSGSGFILTEDGYVVTNYHVVEGASSILVTTHDAQEYEAKLVGHDSTNDVAVLKVEAEGLKAAQVGSSGSTAIGDQVVAIGNALGTLSATQTVGYVSGINRQVTTSSTIINMIQTDCAINPGNSGGPLFNMQGQVIGITTAKYSGTTTSGASIEGIGFAIPVDDVMGTISDLMDYGYVTGAYLGVTVQNNDSQSAAKFGLPTTGAYVVTVVEGGAADRAGIQPKDLIIRLGSYEITTITDLTRSLRNFKAGDTTTVTIIRGGQELELGVTLDEKPHDTTTTTPSTTTPQPSEGDFNEWYDYFRRYFGE